MLLRHLIALMINVRARRPQRSCCRPGTHTVTIKTSDAGLAGDPRHMLAEHDLDGTGSRRPDRPHSLFTMSIVLRTRALPSKQPTANWYLSLRTTITAAAKALVELDGIEPTT